MVVLGGCWVWGLHPPNALYFQRRMFSRERNGTELVQTPWFLLNWTELNWTEKVVQFRIAELNWTELNWNPDYGPCFCPSELGTIEELSPLLNWTRSVVFSKVPTELNHWTELNWTRNWTELKFRTEHSTLYILLNLTKNKNKIKIGYG